MHSLTSGVLEGGKTPPKEVPTPLVCPSPDPAEVLESATMIIPLKMSQFRNIWEEEFSHVKKRRRKPFGECTDCAGFKTQLKELRNDPQARDSV